MYALPELHLFTAESVREWRQQCAQASYDMDHGLLRAVAEIVFGEQTDDSIRRARGWLARREHLTTGMILELLQAEVAPRVVVEKSPSLVYNPRSLQRLVEMFPRARFVHLVSHPRLFGESVMLAVAETSNGASLPASHWLSQLAHPDWQGPSDGPNSGPHPEMSWLRLHTRIRDFLDTLADDQKLTVRGEEFDESLESLVTWLRMRSDRDAIERMRRPEESAYVAPGPSSARFGSDIFVLGAPLMRPEWRRSQVLDGPVSWRPTGEGFSSEVKELAKAFGYA
jgi:hypothetical protein